MNNKSDVVRLNLGCGEDVKKGWINADKFPANGEVQYVDMDSGALPWGAETFDEILMSHVLEHVPNRYEVMLEVQRILKSGGVCEVRLPSFSPKVYHRSGLHTISYLNPVLQTREHINHNYIKSGFVEESIEAAWSLGLFLRRCYELFRAMGSIETVWRLRKQ